MDFQSPLIVLGRIEMPNMKSHHTATEPLIVLGRIEISKNTSFTSTDRSINRTR